MPYTIRNYNRQTLLNLLDGLVNTTATSISLIGKNVENFGLLQNENFVWLLQNFAAATAPANPITGQLWFKSDDRQLYVYDGQTFQLLGPEKAGDFTTTALKSVTVIDTTSTQHPIIQVIINGEVVAVLSAIQFILSEMSLIPGFTTIYRGITFKNYGVNNSDFMLYGNSTLSTTATNAINAITKTYSDSTTAIATTQFVHSVLPRGAIILWAGNAGNVPEGWALCDGTNGTPNLSQKFVLGASLAIIPGSTGGQESVTINTNTAGLHNHTSKTGGTTLLINQMPSHTHAVTTGTGFAVTNSLTRDIDTDLGGARDSFSTSLSSLATSATGGGQPHDHDLQADGTHFHTVGPFSILPPWYALCYIMKIV